MAHKINYPKFFQFWFSNIRYTEGRIVKQVGNDILIQSTTGGKSWYDMTAFLNFSKEFYNNNTPKGWLKLR